MEKTEISFLGSLKVEVGEIQYYAAVVNITYSYT